MTPTWLAVALAIFSTLATVASAWALFFYKRGSETRDATLATIRKEMAENRIEMKDGFRRNDEAMAAQTKVTSELRDKVGNQNGRVGKLEEWKSGAVIAIQGLETRERTRPKKRP